MRQTRGAGPGPAAVRSGPRSLHGLIPGSPGRLGSEYVIDAPANWKGLPINLLEAVEQPYLIRQGVSRTMSTTRTGPLALAPTAPAVGRGVASRGSRGAIGTRQGEPEAVLTRARRMASTTYTTMGTAAALRL